jgi:glycine cleavage system aminomethyltransferase T
VSEPTTGTPTATVPIAAPTLRSSLAGVHARLGADVGIEGGAEIVRSYGDPDAELAVVTGGIGCADITVRAKIDVRGDVDRTIALFPADVIARIADDWAVLFSPPGSVTERVASMQTAAGSSSMVTDVTHLYASFALAGPALPDALARLTSWDPATLAPRAATGAPIAGVRAILVRRETTVPILEVSVAMEFARYAWRSILEIVERLGGGPVGWDALRAEGWR